MGSMLIASLEQGHLAKSGLTEEEKAEGHTTLARVKRGLFEDQITMAELGPALDILAPETGQNQRQVKQSLSDDEVREILQLFKQAADDAQIPDEPYEADYAAEMRELVDEILGEGGATE